MNMSISVIRFNPDNADIVVQLANVLDHANECEACRQAIADNEAFRDNAYALINDISGLPIEKDDWEAYANILAKYLQLHLLYLTGENSFTPNQKVIEIPN